MDLFLCMSSPFHTTLSWHTHTHTRLRTHRHIDRRRHESRMEPVPQLGVSYCTLKAVCMSLTLGASFDIRKLCSWTSTYLFGTVSYLGFHHCLAKPLVMFPLVVLCYWKCCAYCFLAEAKRCGVTFFLSTSSVILACKRVAIIQYLPV